MIGSNAGTIEWVARIDTSKFKQDAKDVDKEANSLSDRISTSFQKAEAGSKALLLGVTAAAAGAVAFGVSSVKAYMESQDAIAQTNAVLKSTGGVAGVTADQVTKLASALQRSTKYSDEQIRSAENLMLTFTGVGKDVFPDATKAALDMSTTLNEDLNSSVIRIGKALQDPIGGLAALKKSGVNVNEEFKNYIQTLLDTQGPQAAQVAILKELQTEFGGSAEAAGKTFSGSLARLKNNFNDLQEQIGEVIVKALGPVIDAFGSWMDKVTEAGGLLEYFKKIVKDNETNIFILGGAIVGMLIPAIVALGVSLWAALAPLLPFAAAGVALGLAAKFIKDNWDNLRPTFDMIIGKFMEIWNTIKPLRDFIAQQFKTAWDDLRNAIDQIRATLAPYKDELILLAKVLGVGLLVPLVTVTLAIVALVAAVTASLVWFARLVGWVSEAVAWFVNLGVETGKAMRQFVTTIVENIAEGIRWFQSLPDRVRSAIGNAGSILYNAGRDIIQGLINGIKDKFGDVKSTLGDLTKKVTDWKGPESLDKVLLTKSGQLVIQGFIRGLESQYPAVKDSLSGLTTTLGNPDIPTVSPAISSINSIDTTANKSNSGGTVVHVSMSGIMTSSPSDERAIAQRLVGRINESLRSKGKTELGVV